MFERFTERARKVMALANQEAQRTRSECIDSEHILLGLVEEGSGIGAHVLQALHVTPQAVRAEVEKLVKPGTNMVALGKLPQTPMAKKVIECAIAESRSLQHNYVGTEHFLLGLMRAKDSIAATVLVNLGLTLEEVRKQVLGFLGLGETLDSASGAGPSPAGGDTPKTPEDDIFSACSPTDAVVMLGRLLLREVEARSQKAAAARDTPLAEEYKNILGSLRALLDRVARLRSDS